jgi:hypothetical protein
MVDRKLTRFLAQFIQKFIPLSEGCISYIRRGWLKFPGSGTAPKLAAYSSPHWLGLTPSSSSRYGGRWGRGAGLEHDRLKGSIGVQGTATWRLVERS